MSTMFTMTFEINREQRAYYPAPMAPDAMDYTIHHKYKKGRVGPAGDDHGL